MAEKMAAKEGTDLEALNEGTIVLLSAISERGRAWTQDNLSPDAMRFGGAYAIEHRYACDIIVGAVSDGLLVQDVATGRYAHLPQEEW